MPKVTVQLAKSDENQVEEVVLSAPLASRHRVIRAAMRIGLSVMLEEPAQIVDLIKADMEGAR